MPGAKGITCAVKPSFRNSLPLSVVIASRRHPAAARSEATRPERAEQNRAAGFLSVV